MAARVPVDAFTAAMNGTMCQILDKLTPKVLAQKDVRGKTPVHNAAIRKCLDQIAHLITPKMLWVKDKYGRTPVHLAAAPQSTWRPTPGTSARSSTC